MAIEAELPSHLRSLLRRPPTGWEIQAFFKYVKLLLQWNRVYSFTGYREPEEILRKLVLDSLLFLPYLPGTGGQLLDLGSGAGIPGIPLGIVEPKYRLTLIEARRRKGSFLSAVVRELALPNVLVLTGRAESLIEQVPSLEGGFDAVLTRAAGPLYRIAPLAMRFLRPGGKLVASGPPAGKTAPTFGSSESWRVVVSTVSGLPRRFFLAEKSLDASRSS